MTARRLSFLLSLTVLAVGTSCTLWPATPPPGAQPTELNFDAIYSTARLALDLTDHNVGLMSEQTLKSRNKGAERPIEMHQVASVIYLIQFDDQAQRQTVAFSGTTDAANNEFNLRIELVYDPNLGGSMHAGYRDLSLQIRADLVPRLQPGWAVSLVGFSQGGAVAALLPLWLGSDGFTVDSVITMGQPKVVDASFAGRLALLPVMRLVAADDMVPGYPRQAEYSPFGRAIQLLDGPYIVSLEPGDPGYDDPRDLPADLPDLMALDHTTYDVRLRSKLNVTVFELPVDAATEPPQ